MIAFKCKMCGGDLTFEPGESVAECPYCGTNQTLPKLDDDKRANLYDRANHFRRQNEFDKAMAIYEQVLAEDRTDAEAYWSLVLCRYGIEYVEDPASHKRVPTVNRVQYASILADEDYKSALAHADAAQRRVYEAEANAIAEIQKGILDISRKEAPFDVFICYKETDANGRRTPDSVLANDMYHQLTKEGFKVFFSRITLEDKIGTAYEPYIFAALNSAKVMVVLGTKPDYFNAVWVKNEWSRYLALIRNGADKTLVPAYRDMDPYDLPEEFAHLQAQDMGKLGFMQDLIRGIKKILHKDEPQARAVSQKNDTSSTNIENLMKRAQLFMEDGDWENATEYLDKVLDENAEYAPAYVGKVQTSLKLRKEEQLGDTLTEFEKRPDWQKAMRFASADQRKIYEGYVSKSIDKREIHHKQYTYNQAGKLFGSAAMADDFDRTRELFESISGFKDSDQKAKICLEKAEEIRYTEADERAEVLQSEQADGKIAVQWDSLADVFSGISWKDAHQRANQCRKQAESVRAEAYEDASQIIEKARTVQDCEKAMQAFVNLGNYRDAAEMAKHCEEKRTEISAKDEELHRKAEAQAKAEAAKRRIRVIVILVVITIVAVGIAFFTPIIKLNSIYNSARSAMNEGRYDEAIAMFKELGDYKDSATKTEECFTLYRKEIAVYSKRLAAGIDHTVGLKTDGTVVAVGDNDKGQCDTGDWTDIVAVAAGWFHTVGLKSDGTVVAVGSNHFGSCDTDAWTDIVAVAAGSGYTVGLKSDGTVVAVGDNGSGQCDTDAWTDIVAVAAESDFTVGLKSDGTVVAVGNNTFGPCDTDAWTDIVAVAAGSRHTVGLKSDGTVVAVGDNDVEVTVDGGITVGYNDFGQYNTSDFTDIVAVAIMGNFSVGLKVDGTVVAVGNNYDGQCDTGAWTDIVAVAAGDGFTVGLKSDGTVVAVGNNNDGQCNTGDWKLWD